jgi:N,N'-diacetyllegionaminate synthase
VEAAELLLGLGIKTWKVASGEVTDLPLIDFMSATGLSTIVSTGLASHQELGACLSVLRKGGCEVALMKCTSEYPCPPEKVGLSAMKTLSERYECPVGISDHSGTIYAGLAAAALGAPFIEVHVKLTENMPGPDAPASLAPNDLRQLAAGVRAVLAMVRAEVMDQDETAAAASDMRRLFMKSVVAARPLNVGDILGPDDVAVKKPADGLPPAALNDILGKRITRSLSQDDLIQMEDLEG